ncbi:hypothetical protein BGZ65_008002 [Modicella reniformis]|uniref:Carrier domain-containing protein n=1 Tax=Modicella reniformis TaxID=1440133 RepID=A0A9P6IN67_9FUNG|nr:hypothetical protein BGZ65_008002 [Modicella reniformis]
MGGEVLSRTLLQNLIARGCTVINDYGPTETTISATSWRCPPDYKDEIIPIGRPVANTRVYILDKHRQPVPLGVIGEMYIGGIGVARGYLNRPELTTERFLPDPFTGDREAQMYKTGDLVRYLPDGNIAFLGRNDSQVKVRGFRIEPGEIEARLADHPSVEKSVVFAFGEGAERRLVAYVIAKPDGDLVRILRSHLVSCLPDYMVPAAFVRLDSLPLTSSGKIDHKALPKPDSSAFARQAYDEPQGETETRLAQIWAELLSLDSVSRYDDFFSLGGNSLLAMRMLDRLRRLNLTVSIRTIYESPILKELAQAVRRHQAASIPPNLIIQKITKLTPEMLPLIDLTQSDIDHIIEQTPGGLANIQDIYDLSPLQDGILFHHLLTTEGDPYLLSAQMAFENRSLLDRYLQAFQKVVDRHDILRTAFIWENISTPAQVVLRHTTLPIQELTLDPVNGSTMKQLDERFHSNHYRIDLTQAPLLRLIITQENNGRWILVQLMHHLIGDHTAAETMNYEIERILHGQGDSLPAPTPFRNLVAQTRLGINRGSDEKFFKQMLGDIDESTFPFGLTEVHLSGADITESHQILPQNLNNRLRYQTKQLCVSLASLCHVAWGMVLARTSGQEHVVFGTVLFGGMQDEQGAGHAMGLSINTLPFRCNIGNNIGVRESVRQTHVRLAELLEHEHASLSLAQRCSGVAPGTPLFSALLNYLHTSLPTSLPTSNNSDGSSMEFVSQEEQVHYPGIEILGGRERTNYPFGLSVEDFGTAIGLTAQTLRPIDPARAGGYMRQALESLVEALEGAPDTPVLQLEVLPKEERTLLINGWNSTTMDYPQHQTIHGLFEEQAELTPDAVAVVYEGQVLTYSDLNSRANRLAHHLVDLGVKPDTRVAICVARSPAMVIGTMAILKAGGVYVPLDSTYTGKRLNDILTDAAPSILMADTAGKASLCGANITSIAIVDPNKDMELPSTTPDTSSLISQHLAYVIYTSGSTGRPKGVMVEHQGIVNLVSTRPDVFGTGASSRVLQFSSFSFDGCAFEMFTALCCGGSLHLLPDRIRSDPVQVWNYLERHSITQASLTPAILQNCKELSPLSGPLTLIVAGEAFPIDLLRTLRLLVPKGRIINDYGPTEATVSAITWKCPQEFGGDIVPIGRPIANKTIYILDKHCQPVPLGAVGELYIGGVGVARGYLNRQEMTAKVFLQDPFAGDSSARMYKTGDMARYLPDGNIVFLGRNDHQVKIRGFRIELGEIEAHLNDLPLVDRAVVIATGDRDDKKLVAYVVAEPDEQLVNTLRTHLLSSLPDYMIPAAIVRLDTLPLNPNGKLDRKSLPAPDNSAFAHQEYEPPQDGIETTVARIWTEILHLDCVSRNDNFFALGGHSLLAIQMIERLRKVGLALPIRALFNTPTLSVLAQSISQDCEQAIPPNLIAPNTTVITPEMLPLIDLTQTEIDHVIKQVPGGVTNIQDIYALSPLQEGILFHHLLDTKGDPYLLIACMAFATRELLDRYLEAVQHVVNRHDILRTAFMWENLSTPVQVVWRQAQLSIAELQLDPLDGSIRDQLMHRLDPRHNRIDLSQAPLLRFTIARDIDNRWLVAELLHHFIGDHSTLEVMNVEIEAFMSNRGDTLPSSQPFRNLIAQARLGKGQEDHEKFFSEMLAEIDTPSFPFGLTNVYGQGEETISSHRELQQDLSDRLRSQAKRLGVSVASLCHLAWGLVISRTSGEDRVVFGTVLFGRMQSGSGSESAMGLFINTLPFRVDLTGSVRECVLQTHERLASLLEHEHASLVVAQRCSNVPQGTPLFSAMLNYRHNTEPSDDSSVFTGMEHLESRERTNYPFSLSVEDYGSALGLTMDVVQPLDADRVCGYMQQTLQSLADALEHTPEMDVRRLEVLPVNERQLLLQTWNETQQEYPEHLCIHHLFEQQVERTPQATALVFMDQSLTYMDLNERANQLSHRLIGLGVVPDMCVAICVERSIAMIVGVLAILKAGGAYVPLDPIYPRERLLSIINDAAPGIALLDTTGRATLNEGNLLRSLLTGIHSIIMLDPNDCLASPSTNPEVPGLTSSCLAYVMYTSGSTGRPKGVMVEHQGVVNLGYSRPYDFGVDGSSRVLQLTSLSFDLSVSEILMALYSGASLYILPDHIRRDPAQLWGFLADHSITHITMTPSLIIDNTDLETSAIPVTFIMGGEPLPSSVLRTLKKLSPNGQVINDYGPTEATIAASTLRCTDDTSGDIVSIGRPLANKRIYILDKHGQPVPLGAIGEIYIGGVGVARGYLNRLELTAEVFLPDPFSNDPSARMYKTGDLARYLPDGNIVFLGRNDHQVKIRGFRIELGEIEARLNEHEMVDKAAVIAIGEGSDKKLVAYVVAKPDDRLVNTLRSYLASGLPDYMIPAAFVRLDDLPLTPNGKLDWRQLPLPDSRAFVHQGYDAPRGVIELVLVNIWMELLNVENVGRHDNFFMLGGHSLLAVKMISQVHGVLGFTTTLGALFEAPTIAELSSRLLSAGSNQERAFDVLLPLKPQGSRPPLFCIHPGFGLSWCYNGLSRHLHTDQPLYGLQARGFSGDGEPAASIDDMALDYIQQIRRIQAHGPYRLLGYSFGGMVAHTMAVHLEQRGERVVLLALMDALPCLRIPISTDESDDNDQSDMIRTLAGYDSNHDLPDLAGLFWAKAPQIGRHLGQLAVRHSPPTYGGNMVLFRALVQKDELKMPISPDDWKFYVKGEIEVYDIHCKHDDMDQPGPLAEIGGILAQRLNGIVRG